MKHNPAPGPGVARRTRHRLPVPLLARRLGFVLAILTAPSVALGQVMVSVDASDPTAGETPSDTGTFTVSRVGGDDDQAATIDYDVSGTATPGDDYTQLTGSVTLAAGQSTAAITVSLPGGDGVFEGDETVTVTLLEQEDDDDDDGVDSSVSVVGGPATLTILDSAHTVAVSNTANASETGPGNGQFTVSLDALNQSGATLDVTYSVGGDATPSADYAALPGSVGIPVGASSATVDVTPVDDDLVETDETVAITLTGTGNPQVTVGAPATASVSIADNDVANPEVEVSVTATEDRAGETPADDGVFTVSRVGGDPERTVTVMYTVAGSASAGADYLPLSGSVNLGAGQSQAGIVVDVTGDDNVFEGDETVVVTLTPAEGDVAVVQGTATVTIGDSPYTVTASSVTNGSENPVSAAQVNVSLDARNESGAALNVLYVVGGSATPGTDYAALSGTASIPLGSSSATIAITPVDDDVVEDDETVVITLTSTSSDGVTVGTPATASVSISDNDVEKPPEEVQVSVSAADATAGETPADNGRFVVRRVGGDTDRAVTIGYSVGGSASPGSDYAALSGTVDLGTGASEATIAIDVAGNDDSFEGDETVTVTLAAEDGEIAVVDASATIIIQDSPHSVTAASAADARESPVSAGRINVSLGVRNESGAALSVDYSVGGSATPDSDYGRLSGATSIPVGSSSATIEVTPVDDDVVEGVETVEITLTGTSNPQASVGTPATASISIADDDAEGDDDGDGLSNIQECPLIVLCVDTDGDGLTNDVDADDDGDGVPTAAENAPDQDTDDDGTPDYLDDNDDGDSRPTRAEDANADGDGDASTNPTDIDGDGVADYLDADDRGGPEGDLDEDGLANDEEESLGTDPGRADSDGDGVGDGDEVFAETDPLDERSFADADGDLVPDAVERADGTDPGDASSFADGDGGGTANHVETTTYASFGLPRTNIGDGSDDRRDLDGDGLPDRLEIGSGSNASSADSPTANGAGDENGNGITNAVEAYLASFGIAPVDAVSDRDRDGYPDAAEVALGLNPLRASERDTDGDGVPDVVEVLAGIDIDGGFDSDGDGVPDAREIALGMDTLDANSPVANGAMDDDDDGASNAIEEVLRILGAAEVDGSSDGDGDGIGGAEEIRLGTDPFHDQQPAPWIELSQRQIGSVNALIPDGGSATATAIIGGYQAGTLVYDWSGSSSAILAVSSGGTSNRTLTLAPQTLPPGPYTLVLSVRRDVGSFSSAVSTVELTVNVLEGAAAADIADADNDGVPDALDDADARSGFGNELQVQAGARMQTEPGVRLQLGSTARIARSGSARVTREDIASAGDGAGGSVGNSEDEFDYASGIYDFEVTNLPEAGSSVQVVIPQAMPSGEFPEYRKFRPADGWTGFVEDDDNAVESAAGGMRVCPPPGDDSYQAGLTPGHQCVQLTIEDGGPNDGDAALGPNGVIKDPGGVATPKGQVTVGQGGGSLSPAALLVLGLAGLIAGSCRSRMLHIGPGSTRESVPARESYSRGAASFSRSSASLSRFSSRICLTTARSGAVSTALPACAASCGGRFGSSPPAGWRGRRSLMLYIGSGMTMPASSKASLTSLCASLFSFR